MTCVFVCRNLRLKFTSRTSATVNINNRIQALSEDILIRADCIRRIRDSCYYSLS